MSRNNLATRFLVLSAVVLFGLTTLTGGVAFAASAPAQTPQKQVHVIRMEMKNYQFVFEPATVVVNQGDTVEWVNDSAFDHNAVSNDQTTFHSPILNPKGTWRYKAVKKGTFPYICSLHPNMKATLVVH